MPRDVVVVIPFIAAQALVHGVACRVIIFITSAKSTVEVVAVAVVAIGRQ